MVMQFRALPAVKTVINVLLTTNGTGTVVLVRVDAANDGGASQFLAKVYETLEDIEYRRAWTSEDFEDVGRLRSSAYARRQVYQKQFPEMLVDDDDWAPNASVFGVYYRGELVSTLRIHHVTKDQRTSAALKMFPNVLEPLVEQGSTFIDPCRFTVDVDAARDIPGLAHVTLRLCALAGTYFDSDFCIGAVKLEHAAFYRRVFRATQLAGPIRPAGMNVEAILFSIPRAGLVSLYERYPVFNFLPHEAEMLFGDVPTGSVRPLTVIPTARFAA